MSLEKQISSEDKKLLNISKNIHIPIPLSCDVTHVYFLELEIKHSNSLFTEAKS